MPLKKSTRTSPEKWQKYQYLCNKVTKKIRDEIHIYYQELIEENKGEPKIMWKFINKVLDKGTPSMEISSLEVEGKTLTN